MAFVGRSSIKDKNELKSKVVGGLRRIQNPREFRTRARLLGFLELANKIDFKILGFRVGCTGGGYRRPRLFLLYSGLSISTDGGVSFVNKTTNHGIGNNAIKGIYFDSNSDVFLATENGLSTNSYP
ncbi:MAG: hypothetical protein A2504_14600 [Bdellovibrionales bacterium RIFOXYD12_FULL_39_22]|nr:MAG: hypothetical protein A2385_15080 [Bdellovibrionales bacterium RIFOXYB1_FULL_39_21]OFZ40544.1 MAG: hypothetical protein A2485_13590 [Bdellovibrionales bacterium RIFOXYC12_FULL_39_17]OFZ49540.1 MAG: hypothetical protein A2404_07815 [Bdellovibrionales bacterium RIFOXYC1_FULL_39_130]OFZ71961.1 MAG: hypothetical protein A2451_05475 [Bdellovibrionales bacterium RIFOXYC2_FULL_39_8]OFZ77144.1 MAG: hypothetical protein A2560_17845 [Bdellovibrionales bacterium RIFOXYD1_FULL_39_84]OFZ91420.1 MAG: